MRCMIFGLGSIGKSVARLLIDRGATIVGAYSRTTHVGQDLRDVIGTGPCGPLVKRVEDVSLPSGMVDVAIFCTTGDPVDLLGVATRCLLAEINVLTLAEGAFFPWSFKPEIAEKLNASAKKGGVTLCASGFQDALMTHLVAVFSGAAPNMSKICFHACNDFTDLGAGSMHRMQVGVRPEKFDRNISTHSHGQPMSTTGQIVEALAALLEIDPPQLKYRLEPVVARSDILLPNGRITKGHVAGMTEVVTGLTPAGVQIQGKLTAKFFEPDDIDFFSCDIEGTHPSSLRIAPTYGVQNTAATAVNRLPDVIAAAPGFLTVDRLPAPRFRHDSCFKSQ